MNTLSFDFGERWFRIGAWQMAFRVYTEVNVYTPDPRRSRLRRASVGWRIEADRYAWAGCQQTREGRFTAEIARIENGLSWTMTAAMPERIKTLSTYIRGVEGEEVMNRRLAFEPLRPEMNDLLQYPISMPIPVFATRSRKMVCTVIASDDEYVRGKTAALHTESSGLLIELHHHEDAREWSTRVASPAWRLTIASTPEEAIRRRMKLMEEKWGLRPWTDRPDVPPWAREICLVLNLHGVHWTGFAFNDYARQLAIIRYVCQHIPGRHVLAFLPGWDGRYNYNWPKYEPDEALGGAEGFRRLIRGAHKLGVHCIPQIGATSANRAFLPPGLHHCTFRDPYGNPYVKQLDWDTDRIPETYRIMANIGYPAFRRFLLDKVIHITERFGTDGIFLDINHAWHNDPVHSPVAGHRLFAEELHARFRDFLLFGEGWYDALLGSYPLIHQEHCVPEAHADIFHRYARATYHLQHPAPGRGSTGVYERGFRQPFIPDPRAEIIPAISFVEDTLPRYAAEVAQHIEAAKEYGRRKGIL